MLPDNVLSTSVASGNFLAPDSEPVELLRDYEMGGVALNDGTQGLLVRQWECWYEGGEVRCKPRDDIGEGTVLVTASGITELSFSFDQNMQPAVVYVQNDLVKLYWYDTTVSGFVTTEFPGAATPRLSHDDKRRTATARSDVIFAYLVDGALYYRQQRDRYTVERLLHAGPFGRLRRMGMNVHGRFQFEMGHA